MVNPGLELTEMIVIMENKTLGKTVQQYLVEHLIGSNEKTNPDTYILESITNFQMHFKGKFMYWYE